jgi:hypothetical protein
MKFNMNMMNWALVQKWKIQQSFKLEHNKFKKIDQDKTNNNKWYSEKMWMKKVDLFEKKNLNLSIWNFGLGICLKI